MIHATTQMSQPKNKHYWQGFTIVIDLFVALSSIYMDLSTAVIWIMITYLMPANTPFIVRHQFNLTSYNRFR